MFARLHRASLMGLGNCVHVGSVVDWYRSALVASSMIRRVVEVLLEDMIQFGVLVARKINLQINKKSISILLEW